MPNHALSNSSNNNKLLCGKILLLMLAFGFMLRVLIGMGYFNSFDTYWYRNWALASQDGIFDLYNNQAINLDYPPIYIFFLWVTGFFYRFVDGVQAHDYLQMLLMKSWPIIFDVLAAVAIYFYTNKRFGNKASLFAAALWLFSPATIFNSAFWGQTDGLMCLVLLLAFWVLEKHPVLASVMFAIAGLTKFQCLYFTPVFLYLLYKNFGVKKFFAGISAAALTVILTFLPFMIATKRPMLFFEVYLNGGNSYPYLTLNAFNFYGIFKLNWVAETQISILGVSFATINVIITVLIFVAVFALMVLAKRKCAFLFSFVLMQGLFMFTTRMHERYQFVALIFILLATVIYKKKEFFYSFIMLSFIITLNQAIPMFDWQRGGSFLGGNNYGNIMCVISILNLLVFIYSVYHSIKFLLEGEEECPLA